MARTVKIEFQKTMPDGSIRRSVPLYDSVSGFARVEHALRFARELRDGDEDSALPCRTRRDLEPAFVMTAYISSAYQDYLYWMRGGSEVVSILSVEGMAVGDGEWLGDLRDVLSCVIDLDSELTMSGLVWRLLHGSGVSA